MKKLIFISALIFIFVTLSLTNQAQPRDGVFDKVHVKTRKPITYAPLREADVMWEKRIWRTIDMTQKFNHAFYYPLKPTNGKSSIMSIILTAVESGQIVAYDSQDDEFLLPAPYEQMMAKLNDTTTSTLQRDYPPYDTYDTTIINIFDPASVVHIRIKEDWFFDKQRSVLDVRILGICPITEDYDPATFEFRGYKPLFWIYFPEARDVFATFDVFNRNNDAARLSYEDIFFKRMFQSYIYKESNVYERTILEYELGMNALLESERIRESIFTFEQDLWEY